VGRQSLLRGTKGSHPAWGTTWRMRNHAGMHARQARTVAGVRCAHTRNHTRTHAHIPSAASADLPLPFVPLLIAAATTRKGCCRAVRTPGMRTSHPAWLAQLLRGLWWCAPAPLLLYAPRAEVGPLLKHATDL
jgi:hypothetical protein